MTTFQLLRRARRVRKAALPTCLLSKTFNCPPAVIEDCAFVGIDPPMSAADVPAAADKVRAKLESWKATQADGDQEGMRLLTSSRSQYSFLARC